MEKIVLTGGPSGGKSTVIKYLEANQADLITAVPEAATLLLQGGFPTPSQESPWTPEWQQSFQTTIAVAQIALEDIFEVRAVANGRTTLVCDRGLADGAAYLPGGMGELGDIIGQTTDEILGRYALVLHLPTSAGQAMGYQKHTNIHRMEEAVEALKLEEKTLAVWQDHPNRQIISIEDTNIRNEEIARRILSIKF